MKSTFSKYYNKKPYYIAELNMSHFGNIQTAKKMILEAKKSGCHCVKLQSWSPSSLYSENFFKKNPISKRFFEKYSLSEQQLKLLSKFAMSNKIDFSSTPYSFREVDFLINECNPAFIKIASMDLNNEIFLDYISKKSTYIILSTGMGTENEIKKAVSILSKNKKNKITVLHCVSVYPAPKEIINLNNIIGLKKKFPKLNIGYSDHTEGFEFAVGAISLGAKVVEKHFTLNKKQIGMDNHMALEPNEMKNLTFFCDNIFIGLGKYNKILSKTEVVQKKKMRRSIFVNKSIKKGRKLSVIDLDLRRPGDGISASHFYKVVGKRLIRNISKGAKLSKNYFK